MLIVAKPPATQANQIHVRFNAKSKLKLKPMSIQTPKSKNKSSPSKAQVQAKSDQVRSLNNGGLNTAANRKPTHAHGQIFVI